MEPPLLVKRMLYAQRSDRRALTMTEAECAAQKSGPAAGFLSAWQSHGVDAVSQVRGAYAVVIVDASRKSVFSGR